MIPGPYDGVIWEIGELVDREALARTLFVMPPLFGKERWMAAADKIYREHQITLPKHTVYGAIFSYNQDMKLKSMRKIDDSFLASPYRAAGWINEILQ